MDRLTAAEVFVQIAERGSMAAAATALDMSRAMVTRYLAQMEQWAGTRLLHRTTRRLSLTNAGEQALAHSRQLLEVARELPRVAEDERQADPVRGLLRLACAQSLAQEVLAPAAAVFLQRHPLAAIDLRVDSRAVNLVEERVDLAIRISNQLEPGLVARRLGDCASVVCASPDYLARHGTPQGPEDLAAHRCLTYSYFGRSVWEFADAQGRAIGVPVGGPLSANESQVLLAAAAQGVGITLQPVYAAAPLLASGRLQALLPGWEPQALGVHALYQPQRRVPPLLRALLDFLVGWFAEPGHWPAARAAPASPARSRRVRA
ncbi:LysR family transcriptional regulator [Pseudorhodoferax sp. Leaf274]|uniref:LysR family transcriptional regulator n=1 Tax=Pseudorhodoferax sp. Leaf274 TaxID=1736318 RepID=UPI000702E562|nr:LysR family transcriptional regulator [Pseudorhodoferax sp. Leaf274]KQP37593.1 LysR family transcriptional regulator [Pseudorhodoferax sp. Leaf274]